MANVKDYVNEALERGYSRDKIIEILLDKGYSRNEIENCFDKGKKNGFEERSNGEQETNYLQIIRLSFMGPNKLFDKVLNNSMGNSIVTLLITIGFNLIISLSFAFIIYSASARRIYPYEMFYSIPLIFLNLFIIGAIFAGSFIYAAISFWVLKLMKGTGSYSDTYKACAYSLSPATLVSLVPVVGLFAYIYSLVLMIYGFARVHNVTKGKAFSAAFTPVVIAALLFIAFIIFEIFSVGSIY